MFAPDGFVQLNEIKQICANLAYDRFPMEFKAGEAFEPIADLRPELYSRLLFGRFVEAHDREMWLYQYPSLLLRASSELFYRSNTYLAPCPRDQSEAQSALEHLDGGPMVFVNARLRVDADGHPEFVARYGLEDYSAELRPVHGAIVCWKPDSWPVDLEREIWPFGDDAYFRGLPSFDQSAEPMNESDSLKVVYDAFDAVCPRGKSASGLTWPEVEKLTGWSRRQIGRALDAYSGQGGGQTSGQGMGK